jgi:hypothetical protein
LTTLAIAGWRIRLECDSPALAEHIAARYAAFLVPDDSVCEAAVTVMLNPVLTAGNWKQFPVIRQGNVCTLDVPGACGTINLNSLQATLRLGVEVLDVALELFLEVFCAYLAFQLGGLLVHGAALLVDGEASLFVGLSGRGKSSVVALSPQALALNDDLVVIRPAGVGWRAFGTPFWNAETTRRVGQTADGPVVGIYSLAQDRRLYLEPLPVAVAASELVANCPVVNTDSLEVLAVISRCRRLAEAVTVQRLHFRKDPGFWALLKGRNAN